MYISRKLYLFILYGAVNTLLMFWGHMSFLNSRKHPTVFPLIEFLFSSILIFLQSSLTHVEASQAVLHFSNFLFNS